MTLQDWMEIFKALSWPIVALVVYFSLRKQIVELFTGMRISKVSKDAGVEFVGKTEIEVKEELGQKIEDLKRLTKDFEDLYTHEQQFENTEEAFTAASSYITKYLDDCKSNSLDANVDLKLLAIGMTFSWSFVTQHIPKMVKKYPEARFSIQILVADPDFLDGLEIDKENVDWAEKCRDNIRSVENLSKDQSRHLHRLSIELRTYKNLPHWHGLWINGNHLFLGRADWKFDTEKPELTVGQNTYRHFAKKEPSGRDRIKLFEHWHHYYFETANNISIKL